MIPQVHRQTQPLFPHDLNGTCRDSALVSACETLTLTILRKAAKRQLKTPRARFNEYRNGFSETIEFHNVHTIWPLDQFTAGKVTQGEYEVLTTVIPAITDYVTPQEVAHALEAYINPLLTYGEPYSGEVLRSHLKARLNLGRGGDV